MTGLAKLLVVCGGILVVAGILVFLAGKANIPLGHLREDRRLFEQGIATVYFPIITCILISVVLSFIMWIVNRFSR